MFFNTSIEKTDCIQVFDEDGTTIGDFVADILVEERLVIELKAVRTTAREHVAQLLGYMKSSQMEHGPLINFGSYEFEIKKYVLDTRRPSDRIKGILPMLLAFFS